MPSPLASAARIQAAGDWRASFDGASRSRLYYDWQAVTLHPDREIRWSLRDLRARARDLVRNNDYAAGLVQAFEDNVIGWEGIRYKPRIVDPAGKPARQANWELERGWSDWGLHENASVDGEQSWLDLQRLIVRTLVTDGEVFIRQHRGYDNPHAYALEVIDADLLDETYNVPPNGDGVEIRMGVEVDRRGRRLAYHFWNYHPSESGRSRERQRIDASEIIHHFPRYRTGQTRGYTLFAPALTTVRMIDQLTEAELVASRMAAAKMGFILNNEPEAVAHYAARLTQLIEEGKFEPRRMDFAPGLLEELLPGQTFEGFDPNHPNTAFEAFLKTMLRGVARAFSVSYLTLTGDVAEANYSSMRAGLIPERDHWRVLQVTTAARVHRRVHRAWVGTALLSGALRLPSAIATDYTAHEWRGRGWKWVDPLKDGLASELEFANALNSRQRAAADRGLDYETVVDELAEEQEYADGAGVYIGGSKGAIGTDPNRIESGSDGPHPNGNGHGKRGGLLSRIAPADLIALAQEDSR